MQTRNGNFVRVTSADATCAAAVGKLDFPECVDNVFHFSVDVHVPSMNERTVVEMRDHEGIFDDLHTHYATALAKVEAVASGESQGEAVVGAGDLETLSVRAVSDERVVDEFRNATTRATRYMLMGMYATSVKVAPGGTLDVRAGFRTLDGHFVYDKTEGGGAVRLTSDSSRLVVLSRMHARMLPEFVRIHGHPTAKELEECAYVPSVKNCDPEEMCARDGVPCVYLDVKKTEDGKHYSNCVTYALHEILNKFKAGEMTGDVEELTFPDYEASDDAEGIFKHFPKAHGFAQVPREAFDSVVKTLKGMPANAGEEEHYADDPNNVVIALDKRAPGEASLRVHFLFARKSGIAS